MSDGTNIRIQSAFISVNFNDLERFSNELSLDEIIFFQYLVFKCSSNNGEWWQSAKNIETKLKIKRSRLETITERFTDRGVLRTETKGFRNNRHYSLDFAQVAHKEFLEFIYDWDKLSKSEQKTVADLFKALAKAQPKERKPSEKATTEPSRAKVTKAQVEQLANEMLDTFSRRRYQLNQDKSNPRVLSEHSINIEPKHKRQMEKALAYFDTRDNVQYIDNAFTAYCDEINNIALGKASLNSILNERPKTDLIGYFLSSRNGFETITTFSTVHVGYGYDRK